MHKISTLLVAGCLARLVAAIENPALNLSPSDALNSTLAIYRSPSASLREQADAMDRRDAAIQELRSALAACRGDAHGE